LVDRLIGVILNNQYSIEKYLGKGGMSDVYLAWDQQRSAYLALKFLRQDLVKNQVFLRRFEQEAQTLARLQHPNIVRFYGIEKDRGYVYILMDYIEGRTLQSVISGHNGKPISHGYINKVMRSVCTALYFAHQQNLIHCDIKPANIMINKHEDVLLADFGITRVKDAHDTTMAGIGTPAYMAPELVLRQNPTPQSDIYSLGIVLYEMVTGGKRPFSGSLSQVSGSTSDKVRWEQVHLSPPSPKEYNPNISKKLESAIMKCLAKKPDERFESALVLLNSIELSSWEEQKEGLNDINSEATASVFIRRPEQTKTPTRKFWVVGLVIFLSIIFSIFIFKGKGYRNISTSEGQNISMPEAGNSGLTPSTAFSNATEKDILASTPNDTNKTTPSQTEVMVEQNGLTKINPIDSAIMVYVPEGEFLMGSNDPLADNDQKPEHPVYLDAFWIYQTEVINSAYRHCIEAGFCRGSLSQYKDDDFPAVFLNWGQAKAYCEWAGGRLPTEAEWEKAARGSDGRKYPWGENSPSCNLANYEGCAGAAEPVGSYLSGASPYETLDMAGNVWEWTADWASENYYVVSPKNNPLGPDTGDNRIVRGGAWSFKDDGLVSFSRYWIQPELSSSDIGFRCVNNLSP